MKRSALDEDLLREAKRMEFPDNVIAEIDRTHRAVRFMTCVMTVWHYCSI